jgi:hypothetical protein
VIVQNTNYDNETGGNGGINGTATFDGARGTVLFPGAPGGDYRVVSTDYYSYSLVYACEQFDIIGEKFEFLWYLTRERSISAIPVNIQ